jgi:hypothetical protein
MNEIIEGNEEVISKDLYKSISCVHWRKRKEYLIASGRTDEEAEKVLKQFAKYSAELIQSYKSRDRKPLKTTPSIIEELARSSVTCGSAPPSPTVKNSSKLLNILLDGTYTVEIMNNILTINKIANKECYKILEYNLYKE